MSDSPEYDAEVRHAIYVERHKARVARDVARLVNSVSNDAYNMVAPSDLERMTRRQLDRLLRDVERMIREGYEPVGEAVETALRDFARYEAEWQAGMLKRVGIVADLGVPSDADLWAAANARPFEGRFLSEWIDDLHDATAQRVKGVIRQGYVDGRGALDIAREIRGTRARKGIMDISRRGSEAVVRTAMGHTAAVAQERTFQSNRAIKEVQWLSVLDHRTSALCRARDGNIYPKGEGPRPPAHWNCRSRVVAVTKGNRAKLQERETYQDWLKRQPASVQDDILGPSRGKLFRDGGYTVDRFVDEAGEEYTLDQLREKDAATFDEVFAD